MDPPPRSIHVAAAGAPRPAPSEYLRGSRGGAATRPLGISTWQPRRRRDPPPRNIHVIIAAVPLRHRAPGFPGGPFQKQPVSDYPRGKETPRRPLRDVLWRHRDALLDLLMMLQCRCKKEDICASGALLWHLHRDERRWAAARHNATTELCGFFV